MIRINAGAGDDSGQGFALPEEISKSNRVKTSARGGPCLLPCWHRGWVTRQEDSAGGKLEKLEMFICQRIIPAGVFSELTGLSRARENFD